MLSVPALEAHAQSQSLGTTNLDSLTHLLHLETSDLTSPALERRKRIRKAMQQEGYATVLLNVLQSDGLVGIISFLRTKLHIEYAISHAPLTLTVPVVRGEGRTFSFPLKDDWAFPEDPWEKKK